MMHLVVTIFLTALVSAPVLALSIYFLMQCGLVCTRETFDEVEAARRRARIAQLERDLGLAEPDAPQ